MTPRGWRLLVIGLVAVIGLAALVALISGGITSLTTPTNKITLNYNLVDDGSITLQLDGQHIPYSTSLTVSNGPHTLAVSKPGYHDFSAKFTASGNDTVIINIPLSPLAPAPLSNLGQISGLAAPAGSSLGSTAYFYSQTWAVITITSQVTDTATAVVALNPASGQWRLVSGPGTMFDSTNTVGLPQNVKLFLIQEGIAQP